ncbi:serine/threonine-protein kinase STY46-like [Penaeus japonicus]|uniref:serine/threonine-protein kinase STY46-like n=1 Tax=Penaeus japonicus TaxID=27405 RepID=UPI001C70F823|nr:serine/threonine-protein kinase STY46-like [Penaeus japonicus]
MWNKEAITQTALRREVEDLCKAEIECLGSGQFGTASLVRWNGRLAVLKKALKPTSFYQFIKEFGYLKCLQGAGGAPKPLGLCLRPLAILISYEGEHTLDDFLQEWRTDEELLDVAVDLCRKVTEIHGKNIIHNDLKLDNVLVDYQRKVRVIDLGNAKFRGTLIFYDKEGKGASWMAPEIFSPCAVSPAQDAFSVGYLLRKIVYEMQSPLGLSEIAEGMAERDQNKRLTVDEALARLKALRPTRDGEYDLQDVEAFFSY